VVLAITFVVLLASAAIRATPAVLIVPLEREFGWSRATISFAISVNLLLYGLIGPFAAGFIERFGPRRVMVGCALLLGVGVLGTRWVRDPFGLVLLWGIVVGLGTGGVAIVLGAAVVERWFQERRGLALGILTASTASGQLLFLPLLARLVVTAGWRSAVTLMALVAFALIPLVLAWMQDDPQQKGLHAYGARAARITSGTHVNPAKAALEALALGVRQRDFWILAGTFFICGASTNGLIGTHLVPACMDRGIPEVQAASLLAAMGVFDLLGTTGSGWLTDRFDSRILLFVYYGLRGLSLIYLPLALTPASSGLPLFAMFYGLDWIATVPPTVALARQAFGGASAPLILGWVVAAHQLGAASAASVAGLIRTQAGSYDRAFWISGGLCLLAAGAALFAGRQSDAPALGAKVSP
jgi:predicted MFS family arabinose efflux permease